MGLQQEDLGLREGLLQCLDPVPIKKIAKILFIPEIVNGNSVIRIHCQQQASSVEYDDNIANMNYDPDVTSIYGQYEVYEHGFQEEYYDPSNTLRTESILSDISLLAGTPLGALGLVFAQLELGELLSPSKSYLSPDTKSNCITYFGKEMNLVLNKRSEFMQFRMLAEPRDHDISPINRVVLLFKRII